MRPQPRRATLERAAMRPCTGKKYARQPSACAVEALARQLQNFGTARKPAGSGKEAAPPRFERAPQIAYGAHAEVRHRDEKLGANRHRALCRTRPRRRPPISHEVDDGPVGLMPHRRDKREDRKSVV